MLKNDQKNYKLLSYSERTNFKIK